jgi:hypothetical protein
VHKQKHQRGRSVKYEEVYVYVCLHESDEARTSLTLNLRTYNAVRSRQSLEFTPDDRYFGERAAVTPMAV